MATSMEIVSAEVRARLQRLGKDELQVQSLIQDLRDFNSTPTQRSIDALHSQAREKLASLLERSKALERLAIEQNSEQERQAVREESERHLKQHARLERSLRQAALACQLHFEKIQREELLQDPGTNSDTGRSYQSVVHLANDVTESLLHLRQTMAGQLVRDQETRDVLAESSQAVSGVDTELRGQSGLIGQSKHLITKYSRRQITDCLLISFAVLLFVATVLYILKKRLLPS